ncbi:MAG: SRPBCC family protein [Cyclobacteriaceae bacterium]|nr:SRPBCC family protein [Cyclobacteriaceae bacterium]
MIKKILLGLLALVVLLVVIGFFLPGKIDITKSISIQAPAASIFEEINNLEKWQHWDYWNTLDDNMQVTYGDKKEGIGASYSWDGPNVGKGSMTITQSEPDKLVGLDINFTESPAKATYKIESSGENSTLTADFLYDNGLNPIARWIGTFIKPEVEKSFDYGLDKIKSIAEAKPKFSIAITEETVSPVSYISISHTMSPKDHEAVSAQISKMFGELYGVVAKAKVQMAGPPFCLYPSYTEESMDMVCAVPVPANAKLPAKYKIQQTSGGPVVKGIHKGSYHTINGVYTQLDQYIANKKLEINGAPWEVYITDPEEVKDTTQWITEVYYPVKH